MSRTLTTGVPKSRSAKSRKVDLTPFQSSRRPGVGDVKDSHDRSPEVAKCEKPKS
jgi:hypothetical protein